MKKTTNTSDPTIEIAGRLFERRDVMMARLRVRDSSIMGWQKKGLPRPLLLSRRQYFDRAAVDEFLISLTVNHSDD